jgi:hypothetical protein
MPSSNDKVQLQAKRIKQIKFILTQRMKEDLMKRVDTIAERQLINLLEIKSGKAVYMMPSQLSKSESTEIHNLK